MLTKSQVISDPKKTLNTEFYSRPDCVLSKNQFKRMMWQWVKEGETDFESIYVQKNENERKILAKKAAKLKWQPEKLGSVTIEGDTIFILSIEHPLLTIQSKNVLKSLQAYEVQNKVRIIDNNIWSDFERS